LAMISHDFSSWAVVEVEVKGHTLQHVLEQVEVFVDGDYNAAELAEYAQAQLKRYCDKKATLKALRALMGQNAPKIIVITDAHIPEWEKRLATLGADL